MNPKPSPNLILRRHRFISLTNDILASSASSILPSTPSRREVILDGETLTF